MTTTVERATPRMGRPTTYERERDETTQQCVRCGVRQEFSQFHRDKRDDRNQLRAHCKTCDKKAQDTYDAAHPDRKARVRASAKRTHHLKNFGITRAEFDRMLLLQNYQCDICGVELFTDKQSHTDHDHSTGAVRGVLCMNCNIGLGNFHDSISRLQRAIDYLEQHADRGGVQSRE